MQNFLNSEGFQMIYNLLNIIIIKYCQKINI